MLDKAGGQPRSAASVRAYQGQVCFQLHVAIGRASPSCYGPHFPFRGGAEVAPGGPEQKEPTLGPPQCWGLRCCSRHPKALCWGRGELQFAPTISCQWPNPGDMAVAGRYCQYRAVLEPRSKKGAKFLVFTVVIAHQFCIGGEFGAESLHSAGQAAIHSLISRALALQV